MSCRGAHGPTCPHSPLPLTGRGRGRGVATPREPESAERRGVTLIELLLVLALLAVIASLAAPVVENSFLTMKLRRGGDRVLAAWSNARSRAIRTGAIQQFTWKLDGSDYCVSAWDGATTAGASASPTAAGANLSTPAPDATAELPDGTQSSASQEDAPEEGALPDAIAFHAGQAVASTGGDGAREVASLTAGGEAWSSPILFFPDGSASNASLTLATDRKQYLRVTLRGLTGVGRASTVLGATQLQRLESAQRSAP